MQRADILVIGGGIVGLATAWQIQKRKPDYHIVVVEKEEALGSHQSGRNSGVLHTGIYYTPGSRKAQNCTAGRIAMIEFCREHGIAHEVCGKVIVARSDAELPRLERLHERATANGVRCHPIGPERLAEIEPHARGVRALEVPDAGIADFSGVVATLARLLRDGGAEIHTGTRVTGIEESTSEVVVVTSVGVFRAAKVINCSGLHSDRLARMSGVKPKARIVPFRGEYFEFKPDAPRLCKHLIYPVPDPAFPFLGLHFTRTTGGSIEVGPNAVLAFAREGYTKTKIHLGDLFGTLTYPGFVRLALKYWKTGAAEMWRSLSKRAFVRALQTLVPDVRAEHLVAAPAGVRAQAVTPDGGMVDDFLIEETGHLLHVLNAPSPAATASLDIGASLAEYLG